MAALRSLPGLVLMLPLQEKRDNDYSQVKSDISTNFEAESFLAELVRLARLTARGGATGSLSFSSDLARDPPASPAWNFCVLIQWNKSITDSVKISFPSDPCSSHF